MTSDDTPFWREPQDSTDHPTRPLPEWVETSTEAQLRPAAAAHLPTTPVPPPCQPAPQQPASFGAPQPPATSYGALYAQGVVTDQRAPDAALVVVAWVLAVVTFFYMLPWAIAVSRGKANHGAIGLINFLLGWSFIGWIAALIMACQAHQVGVQHAMAVAYPVPVAQPALPPAGWYPAPDGQGRAYWDGRVWTGHRSP